jgi:hypothetical protein
MSQGTIRISKLAVVGAYLFLALLFIWPAVDLIATGWPLKPGNLEWRYGFLGLLTAYLHTPMLAMILAMAAAFFLRHRLTLRLLGLFCLLCALGLFVVVVLFPLDVIQLRSATPSENLSFFQTGALLSEGKHLTALVTLSLLGLGAWRTAGAMPKESRTKEGSELTAEVLRAQKRD